MRSRGAIAPSRPPLAPPLGIGVVVCTHTGAILASLAQSISQALQLAKIEAIVVARALKFGMN